MSIDNDDHGRLERARTMVDWLKASRHPRLGQMVLGLFAAATDSVRAVHAHILDIEIPCGGFIRDHVREATEDVCQFLSDADHEIHPLVTLTVLDDPRRQNVLLRVIRHRFAPPSEAPKR